MIQKIDGFELHYNDNDEGGIILEMLFTKNGDRITKDRMPILILPRSAFVKLKDTLNNFFDTEKKLLAMQKDKK